MKPRTKPCTCVPGGRLCQRCYDHWYSANRRKKNHPGCHPDRMHFRAGWCKECYQGKVAPINEARNRRRRVLRVYGLDEESFEAIWASQGGRCAICLETLKRRGPSTHIDHDHATGAVRGLLCRACNAALGLLGDDPERMRAAAVYVEAHAARLERSA